MVMVFRENSTVEEFIMKLLYVKIVFMNSGGIKMIGVMQFGETFTTDIGKLLLDCVLPYLPVY